MSGCCLWLTGLSGAGKTTIAEALVKELKTCVDGSSIHHLDGDIVRKSFTQDLGFSKEDRDENIKRVSCVASYLSHQGNVTICTFISPYQVARDKARALCSNFVEIFVRCPIEKCIERDVKGLYKKALSGEIPNFTGISDPYEEPKDPEMILDTSGSTVMQCVFRIVAYLKANDLLD